MSASSGTAPSSGRHFDNVDVGVSLLTPEPTVSPAPMCTEDTHNTLKYAHRAKAIKVAATSKSVSVEYHVSKYQAIITSLQEEVGKLEATITANREVMGFTIEEQIAMLGEKIQLMEKVSEQEDQISEAEAEVCRLNKWSNTVRDHCVRRDTIVYGLLEKPVKVLLAIRCHLRPRRAAAVRRWSHGCVTFA